MSPFPSRPRRRLRADDLLESRLVPLLVATAVEYGPVQVEIGSDRPAGLRLLGPDPVEALVGWYADATTDAAAVAVAPPTGRAEVHLVDASGAEASWFDDGAGEIVVGEVLTDLLARGFAAPTPAPPCGPDAFWLLVWLSDALAAGARTPSEIGAWHPWLDPREAVGLDAELADLVVEAHRDHVAASGWDGVVDTLETGGVALPGLAPFEVSWFDEGSLSRMIAHLTPDPAEVVAGSGWSASTRAWVDAVVRRCAGAR